MRAPAPDGPILTLEPFLSAVRSGMERAGWILSGLQKTTSYEFEGRWAGESTRSAFVFFHPPGEEDGVSIDAFLDETSRGLQGNLALVVEGPKAGRLPPAEGLLALFRGLADEAFPAGLRTPCSVSVRDEGRGEAPGSAHSEFRFKVHLPSSALRAGAAVLESFVVAMVQAFEGLLGDERLGRVVAGRHPPIA